MKYRVTDKETEQVHEFDNVEGVDGFMRGMHEQGVSPGRFDVAEVPEEQPSVAPTPDAE